MTVTVLVVILGGIALALAGGGSGGGSSSAGTAASPTPVRARMVSIAEGQVGYRTVPSHSYCNRFSAFWGSGTATCGSGLRSEEWCADFAAWVWYEAGATITYSYSGGDINGAAASFYLWAVDHGTWHPAGTGYVPKPGDVAVYGLDPASDVATHVAVVTGYAPGSRGPNVVDGDGNRTGFSVVEAVADQFRADVPGRAGSLSGYAAPLIPHPPAQASGSGA